jgi:hypothetical protein
MIADGTATGCKRSCRALNELATRCYSLMSTELAAVVCDEPCAISLARIPGADEKLRFFPSYSIAQQEGPRGR